MPFGRSPRIHAGEERFSAPKTLPLKLCALALGILHPSSRTRVATTTPFSSRDFLRDKKYSSRTGSRVLYFSPVEFFRRPMLPCSMFCETESELESAARTRGAGGVAFRRANQPRPHISLVTHHSLPQKRCASEGSLITAASQFLIVTPRLEFPANTTKQTLPAISNRYKIALFLRIDSPWRMPLLHLDAARTNRFAAVPSNPQPHSQAPRTPGRHVAGG